MCKQMEVDLSSENEKYTYTHLVSCVAPCCVHACRGSKCAECKYAYVYAFVYVCVCVQFAVCTCEYVFASVCVSVCVRIFV